MKEPKSSPFTKKSNTPTQEVKNENIKRKSGSKIWLWVLIIGIVSLLVLGAATIKFPYTGMVTYTEKVPINKVEKYEDTEPYSTTECNEVNMLYDAEYVGIRDDCIQQECDQNEQYCVDKNFWGNCIQYSERCIHYKCVKYRKTCGLKIENKEREGHSFSLLLQKYNHDNNEKTLVRRDSLYVAGLNDNTVYWDFTYLSTESVGCVYELSETPRMTQCKDVIRSKTVTKERTVVGYEEVQKQKEVIEYHTLFEALGLV